MHIVIVIVTATTSCVRQHIISALSDITVLLDKTASQNRYTAGEVVKQLDFLDDEYFCDYDVDQELLSIISVNGCCFPISSVFTCPIKNFIGQPRNGNKWSHS